MLSLRLSPEREHLRVLCLGAHADDIEIGCAGTLLRWLGEYSTIDVVWAVFSATDARAAEARASAGALLGAATHWHLAIGDFEDAHFPADFVRAKTFAKGLRGHIEPDVIFTHRLEDAHQDHRIVAEITWQTWREHLILEYEIPKYEGDLGHPNLFAPLPEAIARRKVDHLLQHFPSQQSRDWFHRETFSSLMRIRGLECRSETGWAEAFHARKATF